jgi:glutamate formiminotransferase
MLDFSLVLFIFLGFKIYVDGIAGARLEKVRKIINRGGGTRYVYCSLITFFVINSKVVQLVALNGVDFKPKSLYRSAQFCKCSSAMFVHKNLPAFLSFFVNYWLLCDS